MKTLNVANHKIAYHDNGNKAKPIVSCQYLKDILKWKLTETEHKLHACNDE